MLGSDKLNTDRQLRLSEIVIGKEHAWNGQAIKELDISRKMMIVLIRRNGRPVIPTGDAVINEGDVVILSDFRKR